MYEKLSYFILCYNRSNKIPTLDVLHNYGIYDDVYLVVGSDDPKLDEYKKFNDCTTLIFDKLDFINSVDALGSYRRTLKICTYARVFVDNWAKSHGLKYVCVLFDDIKSMQLRYLDDDVVKSTKKFNLQKLLDWYIELLNCNDCVYMIGPPGSSFYIGCNASSINNIATHYGNMLIYDVTKVIEPYIASVLEDMSIVLYNSMRGRIGLFPFGLQVNCRQAKVTTDVYSMVSDFEYLQQWCIITGQTIDDMRFIIPYSKFIPKIISCKYKKV